MPDPTGLPPTKADRFFRRLLRLYPSDFRNEWGEEMSDLFAARRQREPLWRLLADVIADTARTAPREHFSMLKQDIKYSLRGLAKNRGFTAVAVFSLALGIGANSSIYSLAQAMLLRPLAVADPAGLLLVQGTHRGDTNPYDISHPDFLDLRARTRTFAALTASSESRFGFTPAPDQPAQLKLGLYVAANFFDVAGVQPALGRTFRPEEDTVPGRDAVVILSHSLWSDTYHADPAILGRSIRLNGVELTIIGVAPEGFPGVRNGMHMAFYVPVMMSPALSAAADAAIPGRRGNRALEVRGRLQPGVSVESANAEIATLAANLESAHPDVNRGYGARVRSEWQNRVDQSPPDAMLVGSMFAVTLLVLLIACVNVANLLLARGRARSREMAVRLALGASRSRLLREMMTESILLAIGGGLAGLVIATAGAAAFNTIHVPNDFPVDLNIHVDSQVLLFNFLLAFASAFLFGLIPAWRSLRPDLVTGLKTGGESSRARGDMWGRQILSTAQIAISVVVLIAAAMMIAGIRGRLLQDIGFRTSDTLVATVDPGLRNYTPGAEMTFYDRLLERTRALSGVREAALAGCLPTANSGARFRHIIPEGYVLPRDQRDVSVFETAITEDYFPTAGIPILAGRAILRADGPQSPKVAVVNDIFVERFWPGENAIGKRFRRGAEEFQVVGIARRSKYLYVSESPTPAIYVAARQQERSGRMVLMVHTAMEPTLLAGAVRDTVRSLDADMPLLSVRSMAEFHELRTAGIVRFLVNTVATLGLLALCLALVGLYGTMSYSVSRRTREIGIRLAIGAAPRSIARLVVRQGAWIAGIGIAIGTAAGLSLSGLLERGFLGLAVAEPVVFVAVPMLLAATALGACWFPARRAAATEPTSALRCE